MNRYEAKRIQKWIEDTELEIKTLKEVKEAFKDDPELIAYYEGKEEAFKDALATFNFFLNEWEITPDRQEHHSNSDPKIH